MSTLSKKCFKCNTEKPLSDFYKHKEMSDGYLNKCKECKKNDSLSHRRENIDKVRSYDRNRPNAKERVLAEKERRENFSSEEKEKYQSSKNAWARRNIHKRKAHSKVAEAVKKSLLIKPKNCEHCGAKSSLHGHHHDYTKPLDVMWLCSSCHGAEHKRLNEVNRGVV